MLNVKKLLFSISIIAVVIIVLIVQFPQEEGFNEDIITSIEPEILNVTTEPENANVIPLLTNTMVNIKDYGAKGDGVSDDTEAIQKAIDYASENDYIVFIPESEKYYLIESTLFLRDNTHISGYGATFFMPSQLNPTTLLHSSDSSYISNVTIEGLSLVSVNDREGSGYFINSLVSNVQGIYLKGVINLTINDVLMNNMYDGLKLGESINGNQNQDIIINNLEVYNTRTPLIMSSTNKFLISNSVLDANGGNTAWLHSAYIGGDTFDIKFDNVNFMNSPGGGIHIYNGYKDQMPAQNIIVKDSKIDNCRVGAYIFSGANDISFLNVTIINSGLAFKINDATDISIRNINISNQKFNKDSNGGFSLNHFSNSKISDIEIDCEGMKGILFGLGEKVNDVEISNLKAINMEDVSFFKTASKSVKNLVVQNSTFEWINVSNYGIEFAGSGSEAIFRNNKFINKGNIYDSVANNLEGTNILLENNLYSGFKSLTNKNDYSKSFNNLNANSQVIDKSK